jgi:hypothetical protein
LIQVFRLLKEIGLLRVLVLIAILAFILLLILQTIKETKSAFSVLIIAGVIIMLIHTSRKDKLFLKMYFNRSYDIFLVEYLILTFPVIVACCIFKNWNIMIALVLICILIPLISFNSGSGIYSSVIKLLLNPFRSNFNLRLSIKIPVNDPKSFEWISGLRRYLVIILPIYLFVLVLSFKEYVAPAGIIVLSLLVSGFYFYGESREFIELYSWNYRTFILEKIKQSMQYLLVLYMPIIFISLIFQFGTWYYIIGAVIIAILIQIITIIFKYALFTENADLGRNGIIVTINIVCILLPFLWPLPIIMCIRYYFKAQANLKKYLNDFN